jgi:hypothetical protein
MAIDVLELPDLPPPGPSQLEIRFRRLLHLCEARTQQQRASDQPGAAAPWQTDPKFHCVSDMRALRLHRYCSFPARCSLPLTHAHLSLTPCPPARLHRAPYPSPQAQYIDSLRDLLYDLEGSPADAPGPDVVAAYKQHVARIGRELRPPEVSRHTRRRRPAAARPWATPRRRRACGWGLQKAAAERAPSGRRRRATRGAGVPAALVQQLRCRSGISRALHATTPTASHGLPTGRAAARKQLPAFCRRAAAGGKGLAAGGAGVGASVGWVALRLIALCCRRAAPWCAPSLPRSGTKHSAVLL